MRLSLLVQAIVALVFPPSAAEGDASISDVEIRKFDQTGLGISFRVEWTTDGNGSDDEEVPTDSRDIWLLAKQAKPSSWIETIVMQGIEDSGSEWVDAGDAWVSGGTWDKTMTGEALVCVYETKDYTNNACSEALPILPADEAPFASPGDGISTVALPRLEQDGLSISLSITWADGGGAGGTEDTAPLVDIWYTARQTYPVKWVQMPILENVQNVGVAHVELDDSWAANGNWNTTRDGEVRVCVYNAFNYYDTACSDYQPLLGLSSLSTDSSPSPMDSGLEDPNDADLGEENENGDSGLDSSGISDDGGGGVTASLVTLGVVAAVGSAWMVVIVRRRRQRLRWLTLVQDAEALPKHVGFQDDNSAIPSPYARF